MHVTHIEQNPNPCCARLNASDVKAAEEGGKCGKCGINKQHFRRCGWEQLSYLRFGRFFCGFTGPFISCCSALGKF